MAECKLKQHQKNHVCDAIDAKHISYMKMDNGLNAKLWKLTIDVNSECKVCMYFCQTWKKEIAAID